MDSYSTCRVSGVWDERGRRCSTPRRSGGFSQGKYKVAHNTPPSSAFFLSLLSTTNNCPTVSITKSSRVSRQYSTVYLSGRYVNREDGSHGLMAGLIQR
ncbi:hypothetical protein DTO271G3_8472 [Paecilomyces variotii]|nr:hypothetical protein DTO271G3_8472 [Paecilomyces variotii]